MLSSTIIAEPLGSQVSVGGHAKPWHIGTHRIFSNMSAFHVPMPCIPEGNEMMQGPKLPQNLFRALPSRFGEAVGDAMAQGLSGKAVNPFKALELAAYGVAVETVAPEGGKKDSEVSKDKDQGFQFSVWGPILACAFVGGLKLLEGRPDEIVEACEEKVLTFMAANYVLFPLATFCINNCLVPKEHRGTARQVLTVVWNAWLATMGHSAVDSLDASGLVDQASEHLQNIPMPANIAAIPALARSLEQAAAAHASPFFSQAAGATAGVVQGVAHLVDRLPSGLLEKMFSHSLDTLSPLAAGQRSPSDILELAPTLEKAIMDRICSGSLDRICSANLERLWSGSI